MTGSPLSARGGGRLFAAAAPMTFVLVWSTGHIFTKYGIPYAEPFTFLALRFALAALMLTVIAAIARAPWPASRRETGHIIVAGLLVHGFYLAGVFTAIDQGVPTGTLALITGSQPLLTAFAVGPALGERVTRRQWLGFVLGFLGVGLVVWRKLDIAEGTAIGMTAGVLCVFAIAAGTVYQKKYCSGMDLRTGTAIQQGASALVMVALALMVETREVAWTGEFVFALAWLVILLTVGAYNLLFYLLRAGEAARVSSLFYLTPPTTAAMGYFMFGELLGPLALIGMAVAVLGFALASR